MTLNSYAGLRNFMHYLKEALVFAKSIFWYFYIIQISGMKFLYFI